MMDTLNAAITISLSTNYVPGCLIVTFVRILRFVVQLLKLGWCDRSNKCVPGTHQGPECDGDW